MNKTGIKIVKKAESDREKRIELQRERWMERDRQRQTD